MKKSVLPAAIAAMVLSACHSGGKVQAINIDAKNTLLVRVEGVESYFGSSVQAHPGEPIHRVLQSSDLSKVLFAYDLQIAPNPSDDLYHLMLKPSAQQPTFAKAREVIIRPRQDSVRVELMEKPGTAEKVADVFSLTPRTDEALSPAAHLIKFHKMVFRWVHGN